MLPIKVREIMGDVEQVVNTLPVPAAAVLGIAMIAMGEEIGSEMALRSFGHLVREALVLLVVH